MVTYTKIITLVIFKYINREIHKVQTIKKDGSRTDI